MITKTLTKGGAASGSRNLLSALKAAGASVVLIDGYVAQRSKPISLVRIAERLYERIIHSPEIHCLRLGPAVLDLKHLYEKHKPDIIQLCDVSGNIIKFSDIAQVPCPVVHRLSDFWPYHGAHHYSTNLPQPPSLADKLLRRMIFDGTGMPTCRVAPSHWLASKLGGRDIRVIRNAVSIPTGVDTKTLLPDRIRFGYISERVMDPRKGFKSLPPFVREMMLRSSVPIELHIFGQASEASFAEFDSLQIIRHRPFTKADLARVYGSFDILLCPSRLDNSPNVVTEALAHGVPTIGQSGTGIESYIRDGIGGLVNFHSESEEEIQRFILVCSRILAQYSTYSLQASRYVKRELEPGTIGAEYLNLYDELLNRGRS